MLLQVPHTKENMGNIRTDLLKFAEGNIYEEHQKFITTFDEKWRMDENIILIMCAIVLFTSARSRVIHKDVIRLEQVSKHLIPYCSITNFLSFDRIPTIIFCEDIWRVFILAVRRETRLSS